MINGLNWLNHSANINIKMTSSKRLIWHCTNTRHRKRLSMTAKCLKGICFSPLKQSHISFTTPKTKSTRFHWMTKKTSFNWSLKTILKNMKRFTRFAFLLIKKWNRGHGIIVNSRSCIVTPICQSARLRRQQT